ncbi:hypothetical protein JG687_00012666 [Phytophthora cactorum]|uniref:Uncharacterized protein n=1 Tax=Phytophthora cactorum TaxID=29920 RepID=A0A329S6T9_9STRA|nr:hypothetical protein PC115_g17187 [Phytophthora cactorum]KAG2986200.1 hypothetical protein PC119_g19986 [Phytophthora cactorum]KAG3072422.1 hypothetical protein PC122_g15267 [Phytophthora cactorum]KAG3163620.1 hypothetical protein PC128_g20350 [Phytophthora cactorum]KAG6952985.1 hypothetical protein JG687_00012666 [Phytophthora cactorum]
MRTSFQDWEDKLLVQIALQFEHEGLRITWNYVARRMAKTKRSGRELRQRLASLKRTYAICVCSAESRVSDAGASSGSGSSGGFDNESRYGGTKDGWCGGSADDYNCDGRKTGFNTSNGRRGGYGSDRSRSEFNFDCRCGGTGHGGNGGDFCAVWRGSSAGFKSFFYGSGDV